MFDTLRSNMPSQSKVYVVSFILFRAALGAYSAQVGQVAGRGGWGLAELYKFKSPLVMGF